MKKQSNLSRLLDYAGTYRILSYLSWVLAAAGALLALVPFWYIWRILREVIEVAPNYENAVHVTHYGWMAVMFAFAAVLTYIAGLMCSHLTAFRIATNLRLAMTKHIATLPLGEIEQFGSGKLRRTISETTGATENYLAHQLPDKARAVATIAGLLTLLLAFDWRLGLLSLVPVALAFAVMTSMTGKGMQEKMTQYQNALADMSGEAVEYVRGIPVVKTFGQTVHTFKRFKGSIDNYYQYCISYCKKCRMPMLLYTVFINSAFAFLITLALILAGGEAVASSVLLSFIFYVIFTPVIATAMSKVMYMSENGMLVSDALSRVHSILDLKPLPEAQKSEKPKDNSVEFKNVSFRYSGSETDALRGVSFMVRPGETVALVGPSGGGKTTAAGLISRFWDVTGGEIKVGGVNVKNIKKSELTETVAYVFQDSRLLKTSILENVRLAKQNASRKEIENALHKAQCDDIIKKLPDGIDTVIGAKGVYLSGGEQQRIAIARVMLKDAPIIILDEATAFADPENEFLVQRAFEELSRDKTVIMIAHRLTTVRNADRIFVLKDGGIEESGTHDSLAEKGGLYAKMWQDYQTSVGWKVGGAR